MDIEALIKRECKNDNEHDRAYEKALRNSHAHYGKLTNLNQVKLSLYQARQRFASNLSRHVDVADCMVLHELETILEPTEREGSSLLKKTRLGRI